jgi:hemolysin activation/secretion protein
LEWAKIDSELDMPDEFDSLLPSVRPEDDGAEMRFDLAGIIVQGSSIYTARELLPVYWHYLGTEVSVSDLYSISSAISKRYASDGYAATSAVIPTQSI